MQTKRLILMRHAHAEDFNKTDFGRNLTIQGQAAALYTAEQISVYNIIPQCIYTSTANRTRQTAQIVAKTLRLTQASTIELDTLYNADILTLNNTIYSINNNVDVAMIIAHNPGISYLINDLNPNNINYAISPASCVVFSFMVNTWDEIFITKKTIEHTFIY